MNRAPITIAALAAAFALAGCGTSSDTDSTNSATPSAPASSSVDCSDPGLSQSEWTQHCQGSAPQTPQTQFTFGETWTSPKYELTPTMETTTGSNGDAVLEIVWQVNNETNKPLSADELHTDLYGDGQEMSVYAYDSMTTPDILPGQQGTWVKTYQQPDVGTQIQLQASLAEPGAMRTGPAQVYFTGTFGE